MEYYQQFIDNLIALKNYYQQQLEEYDRLVGQTREQLNHVNALLFDQMERQYKQQHEQLSKKEAKSDTAAISPVSLPQNTSPESPQHTSPESPQLDFDSHLLDLRQLSTQSDLKEPTQSLTTNLVKDEQPSADLATTDFNDPLGVEQPISHQLELVVEPSANKPNEPSSVKSATTAGINNLQSEQQPTASPIVTASDRVRSRYTAPLKTPLLPPYQHLTKSEAVEKFLLENEGNAFHIDDITRGLHGELEADAIRAERSRMYDTLKKGAAKGLWAVVPSSNNYYTIDLKSL